MFENISLVWIVGPAMIIAAIGGRIYKARAVPVDNQSEKIIAQMKITGLQICFILAVLWLSLPSTPSLSTFGYPEVVDRVNSSEKILGLLQSYNKALVRTTEVLHWTLFFITIALGNLIAIIPTIYKNKFLNQE